MSDEEDERPSFGGLGFSRGGLGATSFRSADDSAEDDAGHESPRKRPRLGDTAGFRGGTAQGGSASKPQAQGGSFAARMMAQMGWKKGEGLGVKGHGRLAPVDATLRPQKAGLGTVREKSKQSKEEEKRAAALRGESLEDSSEEERKRKKAVKAAKAARKKAGSSTPGPVRSRKPKYVTAEDVKADLAGLDVPEIVLQTVYNLAGKQVEATSTGFIAAQEAGDPAEFEAQKAAKLIHRELLACAETRHGLNERRQYLDDSTTSIVEQIDKLREDVQISNELLASVEGLPTPGPDNGHMIDADDAIEALTKKLEAIEIDHKDHLSSFDLPETAVAVIHPYFRTAMLNWEPFEHPAYLTNILSRLKAILGIEDPTAPSALVRKDDLRLMVDKAKSSTTHYETMIYQLWLPRVRSAVTSNFKVSDSQPFEELLSVWRPLLPMFVYSNVINQLLVPRLVSAVREWNPSRSGKHHHGQSLDRVIFPWLPYLPERQLDSHASSSLLAEVRRKLRSLLSSHHIKTGPPEWLTPWKSLLGSTYTTLLTAHLLPRLAAHLISHLEIDPTDQDLAPFETALSYQPLFSLETLGQLFIAHFFPKFHTALHQWLTCGHADFSEIETWLSWWREQFPATLRNSSAIEAQFDSATETIITAQELGDDIDALPPPASTTGAAGPSAAVPAAVVDEPPSLQDQDREATFRDILEDWCAENDVLFVAMREAHPDTGEPLFRVTARADQRGGAVVTLRGDVVLVREKGGERGEKEREGERRWRAIGLGDELLARAEGR